MNAKRLKLEQALRVVAATNHPEDPGTTPRVAFYHLEHVYQRAVASIGTYPAVSERKCRKGLQDELTRAAAAMKGTAGPAAASAYASVAKFMATWGSALTKAAGSLIKGAVAGGIEIKKATSALPPEPQKEKLATAKTAVKGTFNVAAQAANTVAEQRDIRDELFEALEECRVELRRHAEEAALGWSGLQIPFGDDLEKIRLVCAARHLAVGSPERKILETKALDQPLNPFATLDTYRVGLPPGSSSSAHAEGMRRCAGAALLIPPHEVFDSYLQDLVYLAGALGLGSLCNDGQFYLATTRSSLAPTLDVLLESWLESNPTGDATARAVAQWKRANLLAIGGDVVRGYERLVAARPQLESNPAYAQNMACYSAWCGFLDHALEWVRWSLSLGYDVNAMRDEPDLAPLRSARQSELDALLEVRCRVAVRRRTFDRCLVVENRSAFPITNVVVTCAPGLDSSDPSARWSYKWASIAAPAKRGWIVEYPPSLISTVARAFSSADSSIASSQATDIPFELTCDQGTVSR